MYVPSLEIKTVFDEAKPKHVAKIMDSHNTHGWMIAALLRGGRDSLARPYLNAWKAASLSIDACGRGSPALSGK